MQGILTQFPITMHAFLEFDVCFDCPIYTGEENFVQYILERRIKSSIK